MGYRVSRSLLEAADFAGHALDHAMNEWERLVFAERYQVNLVVGENVLALRVNQDGTVVRSDDVAGFWIGSVRHLPPLDGSGQKRMMKANRQRRGHLRELRVLKRKRGGRFWPDKQIGLASTCREAEVLDFVQIGGVGLKPLRWVLFDFGEIDLHGAGVVIRQRLRHKARADEDGEKQ